MFFLAESIDQLVKELPKSFIEQALDPKTDLLESVYLTPYLNCVATELSPEVTKQPELENHIRYFYQYLDLVTEEN